MAFAAGKGAKILFDEVDISPYLGQFESAVEASQIEASPFGSEFAEFITGIRSGRVSFQGFYDSAANAIDEKFRTVMTQGTLGQLITIGPVGYAIGKPTILLSSSFARYSLSGPVDGMVGLTAEINADGGTEFGVSLHDLTAETATGNGTGYNSGAGTTNGGVAHIQCTAVTGSSPSLTGKVQHSTDGSSWSDLVTFAALTAAGKERVVVAAGTTVNQHLRATWTIAGTTPSFTFHISFARR
jgi:hypothetical protein